MMLTMKSLTKALNGQGGTLKLKGGWLKGLSGEDPKYLFKNSSVKKRQNHTPKYLLNKNFFGGSLKINFIKRNRKHISFYFYK